MCENCQLSFTETYLDGRHDVSVSTSQSRSGSSILRQLTVKEDGAGVVCTGVWRGNQSIVMKEFLDFVEPLIGWGVKES